MRRIINVMALVVVLLLGIGIGLTMRLTPTPASAQSGCQTFQETGKRACGKFLTYWQQHGGLAQQGYPISNEFVEVSDLNGKSYTVQYFERAVFESHPENAAPYDVLLSQLGTFQFKRKYPNGEPSGGSVPTPQAAPTNPPAAQGAKLEITDYRTYRREFTNSLVIVGMAKNTGSVQLGSVKIIATLKDGGGNIVGTEDTTGPSGMAPGDFWPFAILSSSAPPEYASISFQIDAREATSFDKNYWYRDFQVSQINVLPPGQYEHGVSVVGVVKNTGTGTASFVQVYVAGLGADGKVVDANYEIADVDTLAPGQTSTFKVNLSGAPTIATPKIAVYSSKK